MLDNFSPNKKSPNGSNDGFSTDNNDADYIMVDFGTTGSFVEHDDDEYDYCDDIVVPEREEEPVFLPDSDDNNLDLIDEEEMILEEAVGQPSIRQILEKAHESASQVVSYVTDEEEEPEDDHEDHEDDEVDDINSKTEVAAATSASSSATVQEQAQEMTDVPESQASVKEEEDPATKNEASSPPMGLTYVATSMAKESSAAEKAMSAAAPNLGRMSNKKRRKKMKLMKKAAAAAKAVATLTTSTDAPPLSSSSSGSDVMENKTTKGSGSKTSSTSRPQTRYYNKRVASIAAVACATETLASYRAEVKQKQGSKVHG